MTPDGPDGWGRQVLSTLQASSAFGLALALTLGAAAFFGGLVALMALQLDGLLPAPLATMGHFTEAHHRTHDLTFGFLFVPTVVGILAQFRRPASNVANMVMALIPAAGLALTTLLTVVLWGNVRALQPPWVTVGAAASIAMGLHPTGRDFFRSFRLSRTDPSMLALTVVAALPLLALASTNARLQGTVGDAHAAAGHYGFMTGFAFTVLGLALVASLRPAGWRLTAAVAGLLPVLLAATSLVHPDATSSLSLPWAVAAIAWSLAFAVAARLANDSSPCPTKPASYRTT